MKYLVCVVVIGCGGGSGGVDAPEGDAPVDTFERAARAFEGIYTIDRFTRNSTACTETSLQVPTSDSFASAKLLATMPPTLTIFSCSSVANCRSGELDFDFAYGVTALGSDGALVGDGVLSGFLDNGTCEMGNTSVIEATRAPSGQVRLQSAITPADDYASSPEGCTIEGARIAAQGNACASMEVLNLSFFEDL